MADAPPWPNFVFTCTILICPIIIWLLLLIFPPVFANLLKCQCIAGGTLLHQQLRSSPRLHHPIRKKRELRKPPPLPHLQFRPKRFAIAFLAAAWFISMLGCTLESFVQRAKKSVFGCQQSFCTRHRVRSTALQGTHQNHHLTSVRFDSDSYLMGVDGHASYCMANSTDQFDGDLRLIDGDHQVDGIGSGIAIKGIGTFKFRLEDDEGQVHTIRVPNSLYVPSLKRVLLAPHHWAQEAHDNVPTPRGTWMATYDDCIILYWNQGTYKRTIPLSKNTNTPLTRTASGTKTYRAYSAVIEALKACTPHSRKEHVLQRPNSRESATDSDEFIADENLLLSSHRKEKVVDDTSADDDTVRHSNTVTGMPTKSLHDSKIERAGPLTFDPCPDTTHEESHVHVASDNQTELMHWHYRLGHLSFPKLKVLAKLGEIPKHLANVLPPVCAGCAFGAMTKVPWRGKEAAKTLFKATKPGQCVSVDQMISTQVGFFAQLKGRLTNKRYRAATIFVDHFSGYKFVFLMTHLSSEETVEAKRAFERHASEFGVTILHYHADNGRFYDNAFRASCEQGGQRLTFCGVNAHFQNGRAEKAIRDLSESARKQLLHAQARWPSAIHLSLWPYALRTAVTLHNTLPTIDGGISRLEQFSSIRVGVKLQKIHVFGAPVFALSNELGSGSSLPKWSPRCRLGIHLGPSTEHARNVYLVLNPITGLVSPQYHCRFDDFFESVRFQSPEVTVPTTWRRLSKLTQPSTSTLWEPHGGLTEEPSDTSSTSASQDDAGIFDPVNNPIEQNESSHDSPHLIQGATEEVEPIAHRTRGRLQLPQYVANEATEDGELGESVADQEHTEHLSLQDRMRHPVAFLAEMCGDVMYFAQAIRQPDGKQFVEAIVKEVNGHVDNQNWRLIKRSEVPEGEPIQQSVWAMRRKRNLTTGEIVKHKARLNLHGGMQEYGVNYYDTHAPVVTWFAIRLMIVFGILFNRAMRQIDFVMAYPQAPIEMDMYMELPQGIQTKHGNSKDHVLKLLRNIYGQKQAGRVWNHHLTAKLLEVGFTQSLIDDCVFYRGTTIFIVYVDDGIFIGDTDNQILEIIAQLQGLGLKIEDQGHPADYVGVSIKRMKKGGIEFTQRALIDSIIADVGLKGTITKPVPAKSHITLLAHKDQPKFSLGFDYRSVTGKLNYLAQTSRPDIMYAVHQIAKFSADPRMPHGEAIIYLVRYLMRSRDIGIRFSPNPSKGFECFCDADFAGNWNKDVAEHDPSTAKSRSGWIIFYAGCPIIWASKLQSQVALSTTEAEYIALSMSLRDVLPIMFLLDEMRERNFQVICTAPHVYCKVFEDNSGALELARLPKLRPRTKHINVCYHHFREHVRSRKIKIFPIGTKDQIADTLTKALAQNSFCQHRQAMCGQ